MQCSSVITALKNSDTWLTPTLTVEHAKIAAQQISFRTHQERQNMPSEIRAAFARYLAANDAKSPEERNSDLAWWRLQFRLVQRMHTEGVAILAGTDSACQGGIPGTDLHTELALMVEAGLTPLQALRTATVEPARYFNRPFATDLIRPGNEADLTVLNFNPLADIHNTRSVHGVVFQGKWLSRDMLDKTLSSH
jgi:imidazolonepropionase-like amidohydrolase